MGKEIVKINEEQLRQIVTESVKKVLNEIGDTPKGQYKMGKLAARKYDKSEKPCISHKALVDIEKGNDSIDNYSDSDWDSVAEPARKKRKAAFDNGGRRPAEKMKKAFDKGVASYNKERVKKAAEAQKDRDSWYE